MPARYRRRLAALLAGALAAMAALWAPAAGPAQAAGHREKGDFFQLQILHSSDNESSFQDPNTLEPKILHYAAIVDGLRRLAPNGGRNTIHLTAGDHTLPGPFYEAAAQVPYLGAPGLADIELYNAMGLVANGMGNHEFDGGINDFARMLARADYPFLAVNLDFSKVQLQPGVPAIQIGEDGANVKDLAGKVARSAYVEVGGEKIGLVSRAPADFFNVVNDPETTLPGLDFYGGRDPETNQPLVSALDQVLEQVELLESKGINKIILVDHAQDYTGDPLATQKLRGIDVIITAGSTGFLAKPTAQGPFNLLRPEDAGTAPYPAMRTDSEGHPVLVVNTDQQYRYVGFLGVTFDPDGYVWHVDPRSGPIAATAEGVKAMERMVARQMSVPAQVQQIFDDLHATPLIKERFEVIGTTTSPLNGVRADVRSRETNLGRLAADSTLWYARKLFPDLNVDVALKNGGGIRDTIQGPNITRLAIGAALAFDNRIAAVELTGAELIATMENAVSRVPARDGRFPQVAGMYLEYDASRPGVMDQASLDSPSRIKTLRITRADGTVDTLVENFQAQGDLSRTFVLATNDFLLTGGDGYQSLKAAGDARGARRTEIGEQQILAEYIREVLGGKVDMPEPLENSRIVRLDG